MHKSRFIAKSWCRDASRPWSWSWGRASRSSCPNPSAPVLMRGLQVPVRHTEILICHSASAAAASTGCAWASISSARRVRRARGRLWASSSRRHHSMFAVLACRRLACSRRRGRSPARPWQPCGSTLRTQALHGELAWRGRRSRRSCTGWAALEAQRALEPTPSCAAPPRPILPSQRSFRAASLYAPLTDSWASLQCNLG
mmetsp:Transcript_52881/g.115373  ORF Transcript_52881/g.115373 Transcript_52881/m.115373 type:complete len:200 (+) Transcript_52881:813-1412(+)